MEKKSIVKKKEYITFVDFVILQNCLVKILMKKQVKKTLAEEKE